MQYPKAFKDEMVRKMLRPNSRSIRELSRESGVHQTTLSKWKREAGILPSMPTKKKKIQHKPDEKSPAEKLELVLEASRYSDEELGAFLRHHGLHEADLKRWRVEALSGLSGRQQKTKRQTSEVKRIRELEKELRRKDKALAETAALLVLQKKVQAIWGGEDDDTGSKSGR